MIRNATQHDAPEIARIYNHYIENTFITFEEVPVSDRAIAARIGELETTLPWLVWDEDGGIHGYSYASPWNKRPAYRHSAECSIYVDPAQHGKGIGTKLYQQLFRELEDRSFHTVIGGIALPNDASVALHEKLGLEKVAHYREVGHKFGRWIDVGYWQRMFGGEAGRD